MAGPIPSKIIYPVDSGNSGPKARTQTKVVGADIVHEHFFIESRQALVLGVYAATLPQQSVQASAQNGTATGFLWAHVPVAISGKASRIRVAWLSHNAAALAASTPRIIANRFTFTGTASGASVTPAKVGPSATTPTSIFDLRTAVTGLTVTLGAAVASSSVPAIITAAGLSFGETPLLDNRGEEDRFLSVAPGEGVVVWQDLAGTTTDPRRFTLSLVWDDIDTA